MKKFVYCMISNSNKNDPTIALMYHNINGITCQILTIDSFKGDQDKHKNTYLTFKIFPKIFSVHPFVCLSVCHTHVQQEIQETFRNSENY